MFNYMKEKLLIPFMLILGALVTMASLYGIVTTIQPIIVLSPWNINTTEKEYRAGGQVIIHSNGYKHFNMPGDARRSLLCATDSKVSIYEINTSYNPTIKSGEFDVEIPITLPLTVDSLPRTCRIEIEVDYPIYGFKSKQITNEFTVNP